MKTDSKIRQDVIDELQWEPFLNASQIGVAVNKGVVTLSGIVDSFSKKVRAERAAQRVEGVKAVAEDIQVGSSPSYDKTDTELAEAVLNALKWDTSVPDDKIRIRVENGCVKLEGEVNWEFQRTSAKETVEKLAGVKSVINLIGIRPTVQATDISAKIRSAFKRQAALDAGNIKVITQGGKVTLTGTVRSFAERKDADDAAWAAPGVLSVVNQLEVNVPRHVFED